MEERLRRRALVFSWTGAAVMLAALAAANLLAHFLFLGFLRPRIGHADFNLERIAPVHLRIARHRHSTLTCGHSLVCVEAEYRDVGLQLPDQRSPERCG